MAVQVLGVLMGFAVAGLGAQLNVTDHTRQVHRRIGITVVAVMGFQALAAFIWRPGPTSRHRQGPALSPPPLQFLLFSSPRRVAPDAGAALVCRLPGLALGLEAVLGSYVQPREGELQG